MPLIYDDTDTITEELRLDHAIVAETIAEQLRLDHAMVADTGNGPDLDWDDVQRAVAESTGRLAKALIEVHEAAIAHRDLVVCHDIPGGVPAIDTWARLRQIADDVFADASK